MFKNTVLGRFRAIGFVEGISYLVLIGIAMPLKYVAEIPEPVKYVGWAHGVLFILFGFLLLQVWVVRKWSFGKVFVAFLASLVPFGTFWLDRKLKEEELGVQPENKGKAVA